MNSTRCRVVPKGLVWANNRGPMLEEATSSVKSLESSMNLSEFILEMWGWRCKWFSNFLLRVKLWPALYAYIVRIRALGFLKLKSFISEQHITRDVYWMFGRHQAGLAKWNLLVLETWESMCVCVKRVVYLYVNWGPISFSFQWGLCSWEACKVTKGGLIEWWRRSVDFKYIYFSCSLSLLYNTLAWLTEHW